MSPPLRINHQISLGKASLLLAGMIFLSRVAGFGRNLLTSHFYGTDPQADAFNAAFAVPEVMSIVIAGGALATGFVPTFSAYLARDEHDQARHTFRALLGILSVAIGLLTLVLIALTFSPLISRLAPPRADAALYAQNLRLLLVAQWFFIIGGVFTGAFNSLRWFWLPALQPVFFNVGIIVFGLFGALGNRGIVWQSYGAIFGAIVGSILIQSFAARRVGLGISPIFDFKDEGVKKVLAALVPVFFGLASGRLLSLSLPVLLAPEPSAITNASRLAILPLELIASGSAIAIFPTLSQLAAQNEFEQVREKLSAVLRRTFKLLILATLGLEVLAIPLVKILFQNGQFSAVDAALTARVLMVSALALPALGVQQLVARGFYALGDTKTPTIAGIGAMICFGILTAISHVLNWGTLGVTGAATLAIWGLGAALWRGLQKKLGKI